MRMFKKSRIKRTIRSMESSPLSIVGDAAIASPLVGDGRLIPLLIVDMRTRADLIHLIEAHKHFPPGDVLVQWGQPVGAVDQVVLYIDFLKPIEMSALLLFDVMNQGILVDQIINVRAFYLQSGVSGDRFMYNTNAPKILVEASETQFDSIWEKIFFKTMTKKFRAMGQTRQQARRSASAAIAEIRRVGQFRTPTA